MSLSATKENVISPLSNVGRFAALQFYVFFLFMLLIIVQSVNIMCLDLSCSLFGLVFPYTDTVSAAVSGEQSPGLLQMLSRHSG